MANAAMKWAAGLGLSGAAILAAVAVVHSSVFGPVVAPEAATPAVPKVKAPEVAAPVATESDDAFEDSRDWQATASELLSSGDVDGALLAYHEAVDATPDDVALYWKIARLDEGRAGESALEQIVALSPLDQEAPLELARRRLAVGDALGALKAAKEAARRDAWAWEPLHLEGRAQLALGERRKAMTAFRRATAKPNAPSYPFNNLGYALLLSGRNGQALDALEEAVERGPVTHYMLNNLGLAYERADRLDEAELAFVGALELNESYVNATINLDRVVRAKDAIIAARDGEEYDVFGLSDLSGDDEPALVPGG